MKPHNPCAASLSLCGPNTTSTKVLVDLGAVYNLWIWAMVHHNLSQTAMLRISFGTSLGATDVYAGSWQSAWAMTFGSENVPWEANNFWGINGPRGRPFMVHAWADQVYQARYAVIEFQDTSNADGYVEFTHAYLGDVFKPAKGVPYDGYGTGRPDMSVVQESDNGNIKVHKRRIKKTSTFTMDEIPTGEVGTIDYIKTYIGSGNPILYVPNCNDWQETQRDGMIGYLQPMADMAYPFFAKRAQPFSVKEM